MDTCKKCKQELNFWLVVKSMWLNFSEIKCEYCVAIQEHTSRNRYLGAAVVGVTTLAIFQFKMYDGFNLELLLVYLLMTLVILLICSSIAAQLMRFNILQTQYFEDKNRR